MSHIHKVVQESCQSLRRDWMHFVGNHPKTLESVNRCNTIKGSPLQKQKYRDMERKRLHEDLLPEFTAKRSRKSNA